MNNENFFEQVKLQFKKNLMASFKGSGKDSECVVSDAGINTPSPYTDVVLVTISSLTFRLIFGLHFQLDSNASSHCPLTKWSKIDSSEQEKIYDYLGEISNGCCGAIKRDISAMVPALGLSTPNILDSSCIAYLKDLQAQHEAKFAIEYEGQEFLAFTVHLCAPQNVTIAYTENVKIEEEQSGTLEFF